MEQALDPRALPVNAHSSLSSDRSAASWPAIIAGAFVAVGVSLILFALGSGLGFAMASPWRGQGASATTFAVTTAIWLIVMQWVSSGVGGYITGRLRTKWTGTHTHEVFFRDTAHGFVTWAVATAFMAAVFAMSAFSVIREAAHAAPTAPSTSVGMSTSAAMASSSATESSGLTGREVEAGRGMRVPRRDDNSYELDKLFRSADLAAGSPANGAAPIDPRVEAEHIAANAVRIGSLPDADRDYLVRLVAARTGVPPADARRRVDDFMASASDAATKIKAGADAARKAASEAAMYMALSMLIGAFIASVAAALGGRLRDEHV